AGLFSSKEMHLWMWDLQPERPPQHVARLAPDQSLLSPVEWFVAFSPDNRYMAFSNGGKTVTMRSLTPDTPDRTLTLPFGSERGVAALGPKHQLAIRLHPNPNDDQGVILVWDYEQNVEVARFADLLPNFATAFAFHPSGQLLAIGDNGGNMRVAEL